MHVSHVAKLLVAGVITCGVMPAAAQFVDQAAVPGEVPQGPQPKLSVGTTGIDFGTISDISEVKDTIAFRNDGQGTLVIDRVLGSCGCTVPALTKTQYAPGEAGVINVSYNPHGRHGQQNQTVTIHSNDPNNPQVRVTVRANVEPIVTVEPQNVAFGLVDKDAGSEATVTVSGVMPGFAVTKAWIARWEIPGAPVQEDQVDNSKFFEVKVGEVQEVDSTFKPGEKMRQVPITVRFKPGAPLGLIRDVKLHFETNDERAKEHEMTVIATHQGDVRATPTRLVLGRLTPGQPISEGTQFVIASHSNTPFKITKVEHQGIPAGLDIHYELVPNDEKNPTSYTMHVMGTAPEQSTTIRGSFVLSTNVERESSITVPYYGGVVIEPGSKPAAAARSGQVIEEMKPITVQPSGGK